MILMRRMFLILTCVAILTACGPKDVKDLSSAIVKTEVTDLSAKGKRLEITHALKTVLSEEKWLFQSSADLADIAKGIMENWPNDYSEIFVFVQVPTSDQYGRQENALAMKISWSTEELRKVNWSGFTNWQLLNLAKDVQFKPLGRRLATLFCEVPTNAQYSGRFCIKVL